MRERLAAYLVIYVLSFCFFTVIFHTSAIADIEERGNYIKPLDKNAGTHITPTIYHSIEDEIGLIAVSPTRIEFEQTLKPRSRIENSGNLDYLFHKYAVEYNADAYLMKEIARCESGFNTSADSGLYVGLFQFAERTWINTREEMSLDSNPDLRTNGEESVKTAAFMIGKGREKAWLNCLPGP
jgi:hypothetical protein